MSRNEIELPDGGGAITTGVSEEDFGFERWTFFLRREAIEANLRKAAELDDPNYPKRLVPIFWMKDSRRPEAQDVLSIRFSPLDGRRMKVEAIIRRGAWIVSDFLASHDSPAAVLSTDGTVHLTCSCHTERVRLPIASFTRSR